MENKFIKVRSIKDIIISAILIITGAGLIIIPKGDSIILTGYTIIILGIILALFLKSAYKNTETKEIFFKKEFSFTGNMKNSILSALKSTPESINISEDGKGQALILRMYYSKSADKVYLQLFEYIPHQYEPCSDVCQFTINEAKNLIK